MPKSRNAVSRNTGDYMSDATNNRFYRERQSAVPLSLTPITSDDIRKLITSDENGLLPCDFCKSKGVLCNEHKTGVQCSNADCELHQEFTEYCWNTRASTAAITHLLGLVQSASEAMKKVIDAQMKGKKGEESYYAWQGLSNFRTEAAPYIKLAEEVCKG